MFYTTSTPLHCICNCNSLILRDGPAKGLGAHVTHYESNKTANDARFRRELQFHSRFLLKRSEAKGGIGAMTRDALPKAKARVSVFGGQT